MKLFWILLMIVPLATIAESGILVKKLSFQIEDVRLGITNSKVIEGKQYYEIVDMEDRLGFGNNIGEPQIPYRAINIIIPQENTSNDLQVNVQFEYESVETILYRLSPVPGLKVDEIIEQGETLYECNETWVPDKNAYNSNYEYGKNIRIGHEVSFREDIKIVPIYVPLLIYNPASNTIKKVKKATINIIYPFKERTSGPILYERLLQRAINYNEYRPVFQDILSQRCRITESCIASNPEIMGLDDIVDPHKDIDYIIITADTLFPTDASGPVWDFAMHKMNYNNFNVAIINFDDIRAQYPDTNTYEGAYTSEFSYQSIRQFLRFAWDNCDGSHVMHNRPTFVLIIGDCDKNGQTNSWFVPTAIYNNTYCETYKSRRPK